MMGATSVSEFKKAFSDQSNAFASAWSAAADTFTRAVAEEGGAAVVTAQRQFELLAQKVGQEFGNLATASERWAAAAAAEGNSGISNIMSRYAEKYAAQANAILDPAISAEARIGVLAAEARIGVQSAEAAFGGSLGRAVGPAYDAYQMAQGALQWGAEGNSAAFGQAATGVVLSWALGIVFGGVIAPALGASVIGIAVAAGVGAGLGSLLGEDTFNWFSNLAAEHPGFLNLVFRVYSTTATTFTQARTIAPARRDPLILDLDNNGLDTIGIDTANPILFDHDADGIKTATGWIKATDAFLVIDRNGNGLIDDGRELFGDATPLYAGGLAADGFAALAQEDTNGDGQVDSLDARFANLRLWTDLNQDGTSQGNELFTLAEKGIAALLVAKSENSLVLANGNQIADLGGYLRTDGSNGTLGAAEQLADVDLASNPFYSEFTDTIPLTEAARTLPDMKGAGQVRSLREAASLPTAAGEALAGQLAAYAAETTRAGQMARLDGLIRAWADTSTLATTASGAFAGVNLVVSFPGASPGTPAYQQWMDKLAVLERFNGQTFLPVPAVGMTLTMDVYSTREALLNASYKSLKDSVYGALVVQMKSRRWRYGGQGAICVAANDAVFEMRKIG